MFLTLYFSKSHNFMFLPHTNETHTNNKSFTVSLHYLREVATACTGRWPSICLSVPSWSCAITVSSQQTERCADHSYILFHYQSTVPVYWYLCVLVNFASRLVGTLLETTSSGVNQAGLPWHTAASAEQTSARWNTVRLLICNWHTLKLTKNQSRTVLSCSNYSLIFSHAKYSKCNAICFNIFDFHSTEVCATARHISISLLPVTSAPN